MRTRKADLLNAYWATLKPDIQQHLALMPDVQQHFTDLNLPVPFVNEEHGAQVAKIRGEPCTHLHVAATGRVRACPAL